MWCLPGGMVYPGETVAESCLREVLKETGLMIRIKRLTGIYSDPDKLVIYPEGNQVYIISLNFEVELVGGKIGLSDEITDIRFFPITDVLQMDRFHSHGLRMRDSLSGHEAAFIR
jgi:ADP-ribose pyrophosphatase YjhB (NUDIX family)